MPLPTLTWSLSSIVSTGQNATPSTALTKFATLLGGVPGWEVKTSNTEYVEFGPTAGSPIASFRGLLVGKDGGAPNGANILSPHNATNDTVYLGIAPDGSGTFAGTWDVVDPTGGQRWSQYWKCSGQATMDRMWAISSSEVLAVFFHNGAHDAFTGFIVGAVIEPPSDDDGEGTPGRVFGMMVSGSDQIGDTFWNTINAFLGGSGTSSGSGKCGIFRPDSPTTFADVQRITSATDIDDLNIGYLTSLSGHRVHLPAFYRLRQAPNAFVGTLRQMRMGSDCRARQYVQDSNGTDLAILFSAQTGVAQDGLAFDQG